MIYVVVYLPVSIFTAEEKICSNQFPYRLKILKYISGEINTSNLLKWKKLKLKDKINLNCKVLTKKPKIAKTEQMA